MKTAKVAQVQAGGKSGDYNFFEYKLDNGYSGSAAQKADKPYANIGDVIEYEEEKFKNGSPKIVIKKKIAGPSVNMEAEKVDTQKKNLQIQEQRLDLDKDKQVLIIRQSSIKSAVDFLHEKTGVTWMEVLEHADIFTHYVMTGTIPDVTGLEKPPF
jgi:hypothetical protein